MITTIPFTKINVIPSENIAVVSTFHVSCNQDTRKPSKMILNVAVDPTKVNAEILSIPIFIPAENNFDNIEHHAMLCQFRIGNPFVAVKLSGLKVFYNDSTNHYFATADRFETIDNLKKYLEEEWIWNKKNYYTKRWKASIITTI